MSGKWNWAIDNFAIRVAVNTLAFAIWLASAMAILQFAVKP